MTIPEEYKKTLRSALNMLAYQDNTKKALCDKLRRKGYSTESIDFVIEYVVNKRFLNEKDYLYRFAEGLALNKFFGLRRIKMELMKKGFDQGLVSMYLDDALSEVDFEELCLRYAERTFDGDREKLYARLIRLGHQSDTAARVAKSVEE